jgi:hypothetical protein
MIREGQRYTVETAEQFISRTDFTKRDAIRASGVAILEEAQELSQSGAELDSIDDVKQDIIDQVFAELPSPIVSTLQADHREWVHLRDGPVHQIVELYPNSNERWAEAEITGEGVSVSLYDQKSQTANVVDEFSKPWGEVISGEDQASWQLFQDVQISGSQAILE